MPHLAANGCVQATMPFVLCTTLRLLGHFMNSSDAGGNSEDVDRGILDSIVRVRERKDGTKRWQPEELMTYLRESSCEGI